MATHKRWRQQGAVWWYALVAAVLVANVAAAAVNKQDEVTVVAGSHSTGADYRYVMTPEEEASMGFLDVSPLEGMNGGPVLDKQCNVVGIIQGAGMGIAENGMFTKWTPDVVRRVKEAIKEALCAGSDDEEECRAKYRTPSP